MIMTTFAALPLTQDILLCGRGHRAGERIAGPNARVWQMFEKSAHRNIMGPAILSFTVFYQEIKNVWPRVSFSCLHGKRPLEVYIG